MTIQRQGIEKLAAFLRCSDEMVVIYTDVYLLKLWTVYEVASFLALSSVDKMTVVPVALAKLYVIMICWGFVSNVLILIIRCHTASDYALQ